MCRIGAPRSAVSGLRKARRRAVGMQILQLRATGKYVIALFSGKRRIRAFTFTLCILHSAASDGLLRFLAMSWVHP
jgi:hypothetical protein